MVKFEYGDEVDSDLCDAIKHEYLRTEDSFQIFMSTSLAQLSSPNDRQLSLRNFNAYADFLLHLYEFLAGCCARDEKNTDIHSDARKRKAILDNYINHYAQLTMDTLRDVKLSADPPNWMNDIQFYDVKVPTNFSKDFRIVRNKICAHVSHLRIREIRLTDFYQHYHKFVFHLFKDQGYHWAGKGQPVPDLKEVTRFSVAVRSVAVRNEQPTFFKQ